MTNISLDGLRRVFGSTVAVDSFNLEIASGEMVALLGPSGCGKTTTLRMITGLLAPSSGDIRFDGQSVLSIPTEKRGAVLVFQKHLLFPTMTVAQNVGFALKMAGIAKSEIDRRVNEMLELVELGGFGPRSAHELSGGQQQRVALARGLIARPKVLLLDEPLANLDANLRITMRQLIRDIQAELGITSIFVTHDQEEAVMLADRVVLMLDGIVQQSGEPKSFYDRPRTSAVARFFRNANFLAGHRDGNVIRTAIGDLEIDPSSSGDKSGPVVLTVRPERAGLRENSQEPNCVPARVKTNIYMGTFVELIVEIEGSEWHIQAGPGCELKPGDSTSIHLPKDAIWILEDDLPPSNAVDTEPATAEHER